MNENFKITTRWNTLFLKVRFKFYKIHNVEIGANFVMRLNDQPPLPAESPSWVIWGYKFRHTTRYNTKLCVRIEACSRSSAIRDHKENTYVVW